MKRNHLTMVVLVLLAAIIGPGCPPQPAKEVVSGSTLDKRIADMEQKIQNLETKLNETAAKADGLQKDLEAAKAGAQARPSGPDPDKVYDIDISTAPFEGPENAPATIVEFSCLQCPACASFSQLLDQVYEKNKDKLKVVFMDFPLISNYRDGFPFHPFAMILHEFAAEAQAQGKFWEAESYVFEHRGEMLPPGRPTSEDDYKQKLEQVKNNLIQVAPTIGLNTDAVKAALEDHRHMESIMKRREVGRRLQLTGTPTIFLNGKMTRPTGGENPIDFYTQKIEELAKAAGK